MKGNIGSRILALLIALTMILSIIAVFNPASAKYADMITYSQTPGYDIWQGCSTTMSGTVNATPLNTSTTNLYYDNTATIAVNRSLNWSGTYYLYYPVYEGDETTTYNLTWELYSTSPLPKVNTVASDYTFGDGAEGSVTLNRSGLWIIDDTNPTDADLSNLSQFNSAVPAWFWVNASDSLVVSSSVSSIYYGEKGDVTISVNKGGALYGAVIDIRALSDNATVFSQNVWTGADGEFTFRGDTTNFSAVDTYKVYAYKDIDDTVQYWTDKSPYYYNCSYGDGTITAASGDYNYTLCGPWDPPEYNDSTPATITVKEAKPTITLTNDTLVYWGFNVRMDVNITDDYGVGLHHPSALKVKNREGKWFDSTTDSTNLTIASTSGVGNYSITFARGIANWTSLYTSSCNGTWRVYFAWDTDSDNTEEWNYSNSFTVKSSAPSVNLEVIDDGDSTGTATDMKADVPTYTYGNENGTRDIKFVIYGKEVSGTKAYYGDNNHENYKNITVSGDILYPSKPRYTNNSGSYDWTVTVTPTKPGGMITLKIDWPSNGTDTEIISIVNGTNVAVDVESFTIDVNKTITVTVTSPSGTVQENANVTLFYSDWWSGLDGSVGDVINSTIGLAASGNGASGKYTFIINTTEQRNIAPQNITIVAIGSNSEFGYAKVLMDSAHDLVVNATPTTSYAGDGTQYNIDITTTAGGAPTEDSALYVKLYNETGGLVTGTDAWSSQGSNDIDDEEIILSAGTYYLYAYNNTHDSKGHNATITVTAYTVSVTPSVLAWKVDTSQNLTFTVTPAGDGTLTLNNMTGTPNASSVGDTETVEILNGTGTLTGVNATTLGNVTFEYTPDDGDSRAAVGLLRITTATATPSPATVYLNKATNVIITVIHPATGAAIQGVRVGLDHGMNLNQSLLIKFPADKFTDADGKVTFGITAGGSGNITIYLANETDPDNPMVIKATAMKIMTATVSPSAVNEGDDFTVTVMSDGDYVEGAAVYFDGTDETKTTGVGGTVTFTAQSVTGTAAWDITATKEGCTTVATSVNVYNVPKLYIVAVSEVNTGADITVTVHSDIKDNENGVTVTIGSQTGITIGGKAKLAAPDTAGDYTITVTKSGYETATQAITIKAGSAFPGFEALTLIAAIGVAFILLRRRRH
ncbi:hypothetical protein MBGDN05_00530 [Thermoplasmatales archaeon SCGC AB-539-N05]|nr:hypothetical protein MBGDN05_00530 [Thermoplasmatales archaeon SCGC AB-539-N05]ENO11806.1 hypothetical protein MBGDC06_00194 [Thermoplasmatales archaeon SCGC AB-539-C06]